MEQAQMDREQELEEELAGVEAEWSELVEKMSASPDRERWNTPRWHIRRSDLTVERHELEGQLAMLRNARAKEERAAQEPPPPPVLDVDQRVARLEAQIAHLMKQTGVFPYKDAE